MGSIYGEALFLHAQAKLTTCARERAYINRVAEGYDFALGAVESVGYESKFLKFNLYFIERCRHDLVPWRPWPVLWAGR